MGKFLVIFGAILILLGAMFMLVGKLPWIGRLPGDIVIRKESFTLYFPVTTCILVSIVVSAIFYFLSKR
ncbi:MAG: DUF2905 domain-containing protein [Candidatus Omnitrophota bacterium]